jgi:hypothetical protein
MPAWDDWWKEHQAFVELEKTFHDSPSAGLHEKMVEPVLGVEGAKREYALSVLSSEGSSSTGTPFLWRETARM